MLIARETNPVFIFDGVRTAIGSPSRSLKNFTVAQLSAALINEILKRNKFKSTAVSQVILGNAVGAGTGQNFARQAVMLAGLAESTPAFVVNNVCGAGLQAVLLGAQSILCGEGDLIVAGGAESASQTPILLPGDDVRPPTKKIMQRLNHDGLFCRITGKSMGELCERMAQQHQITREQQDRYALESHQKVLEAQKAGKFDNEIIPLSLTKKRVFNKDERPRRHVRLENFKILTPAFSKEGSLTAGNSSVPSDGAAVILLASKAFTEKHYAKPLARIVGISTIFEAPENVFATVAPAVKSVLQKCRLSLNDIDLFEISEAFAAQIILAKLQLAISEYKLNIWGGDIALGHPLGAVGARVLVTLLHALKDQKKKIGLACVSLGGGGSMAVVVEMIG